jgi:hypothetical protein
MGSLFWKEFWWLCCVVKHHDYHTVLHWSCCLTPAFCCVLFIRILCLSHITMRCGCTCVDLLAPFPSRESELTMVCIGACFDACVDPPTPAELPSNGIHPNSDNVTASAPAAPLKRKLSNTGDTSRLCGISAKRQSLSNRPLPDAIMQTPVSAVITSMKPGLQSC